MRNELKGKKSSQNGALAQILTSQRSSRTGEIKMNKEQADAVIEIVEQTLTDDGYAFVRGSKK